MNRSQVIVAILLIAAMPVSAQAQNRSAGRESKGDGVPNWDMTASCRAAAEVAFAGQTGVREKSCFESENRARDKLVTDWSTFPAEDRTRCIKSVEWFSPTYTELAACLERKRKTRENETTPYKFQR
jgi:hypothetical protein